MKYEHKYGVELEGVIKKAASSSGLLHEYLFDLLSPTEYKDLAVRWQIIKQLENGTSHREIAQNLHIGVGTVTRGSRELANKKGGFRKILDKHFKKSR